MATNNKAEIKDVMRALGFWYQANRTCFSQAAEGKDSYYCDLLPTLLATNIKLTQTEVDYRMRHCVPLVHLVCEGFRKRFAKFLSLETSVNDALMASLSYLLFKLGWTSLVRYDDSPYGHRNGCSQGEKRRKTTGCSDHRRKTNWKWKQSTEWKRRWKMLYFRQPIEFFSWLIPVNSEMFAMQRFNPWPPA